FYAGNFEAPVFSDETGHYTHTIIPQQPGVHRVTLRVGTVEIEKFLTVRPELDIRAVSVPDRVATGNIFDVCTEVSRSSTGEATLHLRVDGQLRSTATVSVAGQTEHCFSTSISSSGSHTVSVEATSGEVTASAERTVEAVDTELSASIFPTQLTLTQGQAGVFQVRIENDRLSARQFDIGVGGFENLSVESPGTVSLGKGGSTTAAIRVVPDASGRYTGTITVSDQGTVLTESRVTVLAVQNPALKNPVVGGAARHAAAAAEQFRGLDQRQKWMVIGIAAVLILVVLGFWRRHRRQVMEPQY
ncbi:MAG: hypothetical protein ABEI97_00630, partial [Candidatus Nanohaloarchaea archaeon]